MVASAFAATELRVGQVFAVPGGTALVPIRCTSDTNVVAAQFDLVLGSTNLTAGDATPGPALADHEVTSGEPATGVRRIVLHSPTNALLRNGTWTYVPLTLASNTPYGPIPITLTNVLLANYDANPVMNFSLVAGSLTCTSSVSTVPAIVVQPLSQAVLAGSNALLQVLVSGAEPLSYQWYKESPVVSGQWSAVSGATDVSLSILNSSFTNSGNYTVVVTNAYSSVTSAVATLTVNSPPTFTVQPTNQVVPLGLSASFSLTATGNAPLRYQWLRENPMVSGQWSVVSQATNSDFSFPVSSFGDGGNYACLVTNAWGSATSAVATLTVIFDPLLTSQKAKLAASDGATNDNFGWSVSLSEDGKTALVGAYADDTAAGADAGSVCVFVRNGSNWTQQAKLTASDGAASDIFGYSVTLSSDGNTALVGAYGDDRGQGWGTGSAYVFVRNGSNWTQQAKLTAADVSADARFGTSVSLCQYGNTALVGACSDAATGAGVGAGSAHVFVRSGTNWSRQAKLTASNAAATDSFGASASLSQNGDMALVGACLHDTLPGNNRGSTYVFVRGGTNWNQQAILTPSDPVANLQSGVCTSLNGDGTVALVGAGPWSNLPGTDAGGAYVFVRSGSVWSEQAKLVATDGVAGDTFGYSVSLSADGNLALVGAKYDDTPGGADAGSAYVFVRSGTNWTQLAKQTASDGAAEDWFGLCVSLSGDGSTALVGAYQHDTAAGTNAGSAYVFQLGARAPTIIEQPISQVVVAGSNVTVFVTPGGEWGLSFQWFKSVVSGQWSEISGANAPTLQLFNASTNDSGSYRVVLSNALGVVTSQVARVVAIDPTKQWTGGGDDRSWSDALNWSGNTLPTAADRIWIGSGGNTITNVPGGLTLHSLVCWRSLALTGSLTVTGAVDVAQSLSLAPGTSLTTSGSNAVLVAHGSTIADAVNLSAQNGGVLSLPGLTNYDTLTSSPTWSATGAGSLLDLSALKSVNGPANNGQSLTITAANGGGVNLSVLPQIIASMGSSDARVYLTASGAGSMVRLDSLTQFLNAHAQANNFASISGIDGGQVVMSSLQVASGLGLSVNNASMSLPVLTNFSFGLSGAGGIYWIATGPGSVLDLSALKTLNGPTANNQHLDIQVSGGGLVNLAALPQIIAPTGSSDARVYLTASGAGSMVRLDSLSQFLNAHAQANNFASIAGIDGGQVVMPSLQVASGLGLSVNNASMSLPLLTNFSFGLSGAGGIYWTATGPGSVLDLSALRTLNGPAYDNQHLYIQALSGGVIDLSGLQTLIGSYSGGSVARGTFLTASGVGSQISLTGLQLFQDLSSVGDSALQQNTGGWISRNPGAVYDGVDLQLAPLILQQPQSQSALVSSSVTFTLIADGSLPLRYQWRFNATNLLAGATNASLTLNPVWGSHAGSYSVVVTNAFGSVTSAVANLSVALPLAVTQQGRGTVVYSPTNYGVGSNVTLTATAGRWYQFLRWSDGNTNNPRPITIGLTNIYTAIFSNTVPLETVVAKQWEQDSGGSVQDYGVSIQQTADGGFIFAGRSQSLFPPSGNKNAPCFGDNDCWVIKMDARGNKLWERSFGGSYADSVASLQQTVGGGFILGGSSESGPSGNKTSPNYGKYDAWVLRLDPNGNKLWEQSFGGTNFDQIGAIQQTADGGFILGGSSESGPSGNKTSLNYGGFDYWVLRLDANGNKLWEQSFGGAEHDVLNCLQQTEDGGFIFGGYSRSGPTGTKTSPNFGNSDFWVVKIDSNGNKQWENAFGGSLNDEMYSLVQTDGGGFVLGGDSSSPNDGTKSATNYGSSDGWVVRIDASGNRLWESSLGGNTGDSVRAMVALREGGFALGGFSASGPNGNKTSGNYGQDDFWLVRLDDDGRKLWDYSFGGTDVDGMLGLQQNSDGGLILGGYSRSGVNGNKTAANYGEFDMWAIKLSVFDQPVGTPKISVNGQVTFGGSFLFADTNTIEIQMETSFPGGYVLFTTDGSDPNGGEPYFGPFTVSAPKVIRAVAYDENSIEFAEADPVVLYAIPRYDLTVETVGTGTVVTEPEGSPYLSNTLVSLTAAPATNWVFSHWTGATNTTNAAISLTMDTNRSVQAVFLPLFWLTVVTNGNGGVAIDPPAGPHLTNTTVSLTATPGPEWFFAGWTGDASGSSTSLVVTLDRDRNIQANFLAIPRYALTVTTNGSGSISLNPLPSTNNTYLSNTVVTLSATAAPEWYFVRWTGDADSTNPTLAITLDRAQSIQAVFYAIPKYTLSATTAGGGSISLNPPPSTNGNYLSNTVVVLTATTNTGWSFLYWTGDVSSALSPQPITLNRSLSVQAVFGSPITVTTPTGGTITKQPANGPYPFGSAIRFSAVPNFTNYFRWWGGAMNLKTNNPISFVITNANPTNSAVFANLPSNTFSLSVLINGSGSVTKSPWLNYYTNGTNITLTATPDTNWVFANWSGDTNTASFGNSSVTVTMNTNKAVTASFTLPPAVAITSPTNGATVGTSGNIPISASASDTDGTVSRVEFYAGASLVGSATNGPFSVTWSNVTAGNYTLTARAVDNLGVASTSSPVNIGVVMQPSIVTGPTNQTVEVGSNAIFTVTAAGTEPLSYQWLFNGTNIAGATNAQLSTTNTQPSAEGWYAAVVSNPGGSVTSSPAFLSVNREYTFITLAGLAGSQGGADGTGSVARFHWPDGVVVDSAGNAYVTEYNNHTIRRVKAGGEVTTLAGLAGEPGSADGTGNAARFSIPYGVALDSAGNLYVADLNNHTIRKVSTAGEVTTLAGLAGNPGSADGMGSAARFNMPAGVAVDSAGIVYVAEWSNHTIRKVSAAGEVTTLAGLAGNPGSADGTGSAARFNYPVGVAVDGVKNAYVTDYYNDTIRKVSAAGEVTTLAGLAGSQGSADGTGSTARFYGPAGVAVDSAGNVYVTDLYNNTIRKGAPACPDRPTIDLANALLGTPRQLDTAPQTAVAWQWTVGQRPAGSTAALSDAAIRNPTFTPDVAGVYQFRFAATNAAGQICIRTLAFNAVSPPTITAQPLSQIAVISDDVTFTITVTGTAPLNYQWLKDGTVLADGGRISGTTTASLTISTVQTNDTGQYSVTVSNTYGSVTGQVAILTLRAPDLSSALVAYYPFDGDALDKSGSGSHGTVFGARLASDRFGVPNHCYTFNGSSDYIKARGDLLPRNERTVALWFRASTGSGYIMPLAYGGAGCGQSLLMRIFRASGALGMVNHCEVGNFIVTSSSSVVNQWHHWVGVVTQNKVAIYLDGELLGSRDGGFPTTGTAGTDLCIGAGVYHDGHAPWADGAGLDYFDGQIDDIRIYARALSAGDVMALNQYRTTVPDPLIVLQPATCAVLLEASTNFSVSASGTQPFTYQWLRDGQPVVGATNPIFHIVNAQKSDAGPYSVVVSNANGSVASQVAMLTVYGPLEIVGQPMSQTNLSGINTSLSVSVLGVLPIAYQWYFNETNLLTGATNAILTLNNLQAGQAGNYQVVVSNAPVGCLTSLVATITVQVYRTIPGLIDLQSQPGYSVLWDGNNGDFFGAAAVSNNLALASNYAMAFGSGEYGGIHQVAHINDGQYGNSQSWIPGGGGSPFIGVRFAGLVSISSLAWGRDNLGSLEDRWQGTYTIQVTTVGMPDAATSETGNPATGWATIGSAVYGGANAQFNPAWRHRFEVMQNAGPVLATGLRLKVSNGGICIDELEVNGVMPDSWLALAAQPQDQIAHLGGTATFSATAVGTAPITYQWRKDGTNLANGAMCTNVNTPQLSLLNVNSNHVGYYSVLVTNASGFLTSTTAYLRLLGPIDTNLPAGLVAWWPGDGDANDLIGGNHGTIQNGAGFIAGKVGQAFSFDGNDGALWMAQSSSLNIGSGEGLSIEAWIFPAGPSQSYGVSGPVVEWQNGVHLWQNANLDPLHGLAFNLVDNTSQYHVLWAEGVVAQNEWNHVTATYSKLNGMATLYLNGNAVEFANLGVFTPQTSTPLAIGRREPGSFGGASTFHGRIDEVTLYNRALSPSEVQSHYLAGTNGYFAPLPPIITVQPQSQAVSLASNVTFTVTAVSTLPLNYQWQRDSLPLTEATNSQWQITNAQLADAGNYSVIVGNAYGSVTSAVAVLTVCGSIVSFPDPNLEAAVRLALSKPTGDFTPADLLGLTSLSVDNRGITNLAGLEWALHLGFLSAKGNEIRGLAPLVGLTNLEELDLNDNHVTDLAALSGLTRLTRLDLPGNAITNAAPLAGLTNLTYLRIGYNQLADITPLASLTKLTDLILDVNAITNLSPVANLRALDVLSLYDNHISDLAPLAGLTNLTQLTAGHNPMTNLAPVASLTRLIYLNLEATAISSLTPLAGLTNLTQLNVGENGLANIAGLSGLSKLTSLVLYNNALADLAPLTGLTNLTVLYLNGNRLTDPSPLAQLTGLTVLYVSGNYLTTLAPLAGLTNLAAVEVQENYLDVSAGSPSRLVIDAWLSRGATVSYQPQNTLPGSAPTIMAQPQSQTVLAGSNATFSVTADGTPPLLYQWFHNGLPLGGGTNSQWPIANCQPPNAGSYSVVVSNGYGSLTSSVATLTVNYLLTLFASGSGSVAANPNLAGYLPGTNATLTATPATNHVFLGWSGDTNGTTNPLTITMNGHKTITAQFGPLLRTLSTSVVGQGSVTRNPDTSSYTNGSTVQLTASPISGWRFTGWSGALSGSSNPASLLMDADRSVTATFASNTPPTVALTLPTDGASFTAPVNLALEATASDGAAVAHVDFFAGTNLLASVSQPSTNNPQLFTTTWTNAPVGSNTLVAVAVNSLGLAATSAPVNVVVQTALPEIALTSPTNGNVFTAPADILLNALASDADNSLARVEFFAGTNLLGRVTNSPYRLTWTNVGPGAYALSARAVDSFGPVVTSQVAQVTVNVPQYPAVFHFSAASYDINESGGTLTVTVQNDGTLGGTVNYTTVDVTAQAGAAGDYTRAQGSLTFTNGETSRTIPISIREDYLFEADETFEVRLSNPSEGASLGTPPVAVVIIHDNDAAGATNSLLAIGFPSAPPETTGRLRVTLLPPEANGQWRFPWELAWRNSGQLVTNVTADNYTIEFRTVDGYEILPPTWSVAVGASGITEYTNEYFAVGNTGYGWLTVTVEPNTVASNGGWRFLGETAWRASGDTVTNLTGGSHLIEFKPVTGWSAPAARAVVLTPDQGSLVTGSYLLAATLPGGVALPVPLVNFSLVNDSLSYTPQMDYAFNGQLRSDVGFGSGVAVREKVVLTAAHVVFNDQTLSYVGEVNWFFQKHAGESDPKPQTARGWYVLSGYASARTNDMAGGLSPGQSSMESRQWDVAALYFIDAAARGGFGGYLTSDAGTNEWLVSSRQKMLVGYPVDGASFGYASVVPGKMHKVEPLNYAFTLQSNRVYTTPGFLSFPGNSGGPVCVLHSNNTYYPAGVYLGTIGGNLSVVRAIDSNVVNLINLAANMGDAGTNFTGGGVITVIPTPGGGTAKGYLQVHIGPPAAVAAGAGWRLAGMTNNFSTNANFTRQVTNGGGFSLEFKPLPGWNLPTNQTVTVVLGQTVVLNVNYTLQSQVRGSVALEAFAGPTGGGRGTRLVTFTAKDTNNAWLGTWQLPLAFTNGLGTYMLSNVPPNAAWLSAKTAWHLRQRRPVAFSTNTALVEFTGLRVLPVGDLDGSNLVGLGDYYLMAARWYTTNAAADLDGNGRVELEDYFLLGIRWNQTGDPE